MALLWPLGACVLYGAIVLTDRLRLAERAERVVAVALLANALVVAPIFALGCANVLTRTTLGVAIVLLTVVAALLADKQTRAAESVASDLVRAPLSVFRAAFAENAPVALVGLAAAGYALFSIYAAFWAPTWRSFDSLWYHEPIVGFAIQNRGFAWVALPPELEIVNANPRASELLQVFFALYGGRRFVELPASFAFIGAGFAVYALLGRFSARASLRLGFTSAILLVPAFFLQLGTTYIDTHVYGLLVAAWLFTTAKQVTRAHLLLVTLAVALAMGAKATMYLPGGLTMLAAAARHVRGGLDEAAHVPEAGPGGRRDLWRAIGRAGAAIAGSGAIAANTLARNWVHYRNPVFPIPLSVPALGIEWTGLGKPFEDEAVLESFEDVWRTALASPIGDGRYNYRFYVLPHTAREAASAFNYGYAVAYVLVPFGCVALLYLGLRFVLSPALPLGRERLRASTSLLVLFVVCLAHFETLHYLHLARYHGILLTLLAAAIVAAVESLSKPKWGAALAGAACLLALVSLHLQQPRCFLLPRDLEAMQEAPYPDREVTPEFGAPTTLEGGLYRARDFGEGSIVAYTDGLQAIAPLWNDAYSNQVVYVRDDPQLQASLDASGAQHFLCAKNCWEHPNIRRTWRSLGTFFVFSSNTALYARPR